MDYPILSVSKIKCWKSCRQKYFYKYIQKVKPKRQAKPFFIGSIVHEAMENYLCNKDSGEMIEKYVSQFNAMDGLSQEYYGFDFPVLIQEIVNGYYNYWGPQDQNLIVHEIELEFGYTEPCEILPNLFLRGRIDALIENDRGLWIMEHKTCKSVPDDDFRFTDIQTSLYQLVLQKLGYSGIKGSCYDYIRKKIPAVPEVLKNGSLSKRKNIDTTYEVYLKSIEENGDNPQDYAEILDSLKQKGNSFYRRAWVSKPDVLMLSMAIDSQNVAEDIVVNADKPFRAFGMECNRCEYRALCESELMGYDTEFLLRNQYVSTGSEDVIEITEDSDENIEVN